MDISLTTDHPGRLVATLTEGPEEAVVTAAHRTAASTSLLEALEATREDGYAECYWFEQAGQYWWLFRREDTRLEVAVLWSSGTVTGWQHVFRAADEFSYFMERVQDELAELPDD
jgi:hypothetical protein